MSQALDFARIIAFVIDDACRYVCVYTRHDTELEQIIHTRHMTAESFHGNNSRLVSGGVQLSTVGF